MGLFMKAFETYEANSANIGVFREGHSTLCPLGYVVQKAQIEIHLSVDGRFISARKLSKQEEKTMIPTTEESARRTSGSAAHPLCDQIIYVADFDPIKHGMYLEALTAWAHSAFGHPTLNAVLAYARGGSVMRDLRDAGIIQTDVSGKPISVKRMQTLYAKYLIRWVVNGVPCWRDEALFRAFERYLLCGLSTRQGLCMISGETVPLAVSHDKGLVASSYGAKLISSNDTVNFTYLGRFLNADEALSIGYVTSQKVHKALRWVVAEYGKTCGKRTFVCWNPMGRKVFNPMTELFGEAGEPTYTEADYRSALQVTLASYQNRLPQEEGVVIAVFDSVTTGRLSLVGYYEMPECTFYDRVQSWYESCVWPNGVFGLQSPPLVRLAHYAHGVQRDGMVICSDRLARETASRLLQCMISAAFIPRDIVVALAERASQPLNFDQSNWCMLLHAACAVMRKYENDRLNREEWTTMLDPEKKDRSYQYGRLLAIMEAAERGTYEADENREPNAIRMMSVYRARPLYAANIISEQLNPYFQRMSPGLRVYYRTLMDDTLRVIHEFPPSAWNQRLDDTFLMGYSLQRIALYTKQGQTKPVNHKD